MTQKHKNLVKDALNAISAIHADTSVDKKTTLSSLKEIADECDILIDSVETSCQGDE